MSHPPIFLIHGWGFGPDCWDTLRIELATHQINTQALALNGYTTTNRTVSSTIETLAQELAVMLPLNARAVGWSLGGMALLQCACTLRPDLTQLATLGTSLQFVASESWPHAMSPADFALFRDTVATDPQKGMMRFQMLQPAVNSPRAEQRKLLAQLKSLDAAADFATLMAGLNILETTHLHALSLPTNNRATLIAGEQDRLVSTHSVEQSATRLHAQFLEIPATGHAPHIEAPATTAKILAKKFGYPSL